MRIGQQNKNKGFTLIEFLVVIFIIAVLAAAILVSLSKARMSSRDNRRKSDLATLQQALEMYYSDNHKFPTGTGWPGECVGVQNLSSQLQGYLAPIPQEPLKTPLYLYTPSSDSMHYILMSILENTKDADYNRNYGQTWWGISASQAEKNCQTVNYGAGKTYHYYVSSD